MEEAIQKADVLIEALQWIRQFRGKTTVINMLATLTENVDGIAPACIQLCRTAEGHRSRTLLEREEEQRRIQRGGAGDALSTLPHASQ